MNDINTLRNVLFETLESLQNSDKNIDLERVKAINEISQTIINTAKVEVAFLSNIGGKGTNFVPFSPLNLGKD